MRRTRGGGGRRRAAACTPARTGAASTLRVRGPPRAQVPSGRPAATVRRTGRVPARSAPPADSHPSCRQYCLRLAAAVVGTMRWTVQRSLSCEPLIAARPVEGELAAVVLEVLPRVVVDIQQAHAVREKRVPPGGERHAPGEIGGAGAVKVAREVAAGVVE